MEQLIGRLFPGVAVKDPNELSNLADCLEESQVQIRFMRDKLSVTANGSTVQCTLASSAAALILQEQPSRGLDNEGESFVTASTKLPPARTTSLTSRRPARSCERILQNSSGTLCYFGPSSSMAFVMQLREELISTATQNPENLQPKQRRLRQEFAADDGCCTMEEPSTADNLEARAHGQRGSLQCYPEDSDEDSISANFSTSAISERPQKFVDFLPPREEVEHLVELFFVHIHPNMTLFHRPLFQNALEGLWTPEVDSQDVGWLTCCCLVLVFGCKHFALTSSFQNTPRSRSIRHLQQKLVDMALGNVAQLIQSATIQSVQALALLSLYLNTTRHRNASWIMMGCSIRMAISLGMHRSDNVLQQKSILSTAVERELRKRVWWSLYIFEQYNSALFGRPSAIDELETTTDLPTDSVLDEGYHRPPGLLKHDISLARIVNKIRRSQADQRRCARFSGGGSGPSLADDQMALRLLNELDTWFDKLPSFLRFDASNQSHIYPSHFRQLVTLQLRYQHARLLLTRSFYLRLMQNRSSSGQPAAGLETDLMVKFGDICVTSALASWRLARNLWERGQFNGDIWLDGVFLYQCGMVLSLACLDTRQRPSVTQVGDDRRVVYHAIESILSMLHDMPLDNPMSRMVQIADDFCNIVRSMKSEHAASVCDNPTVQDPSGDQQEPLPWSSSKNGQPARNSPPQAGQSRTSWAAESPTSMDALPPSWASAPPPLATVGGEVTPADDGDQEFLISASAWNVEGTQLIDSMLDWDLSQVFGFDGGGPMNNPFLV
ncbi:uncharacterized protein A1O5_03542 [Cladophialophora psammophila CBS 110553]|uniref:Xylanolytic transcriptional activator regulatory domain-containing protein n=1 Tax=Cladophialophora psammophila CBS 110553 TaxID=1182543 RepID=W9X8V9_9EURO|nr:uncharacterized protein A1O5_03542 [Cladophialophora psammophila CBS 110553]EXJ73780.1 hypothetical protein A1O5_03542 [Cladophialophora psammophila CBS 110553]